MEDTFHPYAVEVEDWHWWYRVRREILESIIAPLRLDAGRARLLDLGCGTGGNSIVLARHGRVVGLERRADAFRLSMHRPYSHRVVSEIGAMLPFADASFDVVCALDVIEHLDDDAACARELARVCRPDGRIIIFVPAFQILWGYNDDYSHHRRRYTRPQLEALVRKAGMIIDEAGYFNMVLFAPTLAARVAQRLFPKALDGMEHSDKRSPMHDVLARIFALEVPLLRRRRLVGSPGTELEFAL